MPEPDRVSYATDIKIPKCLSGRIPYGGDLERSAPQDLYDIEELKDSVLPDIEWQEARHINVRRYSSTQDRKMVLGGIKGFVQLGLIPNQMLPVFLAGELTHIGKNTSFGFGRYSVV